MLQNASRQFYNWKTFPPRGKYCKKRLKGEGWLLEKNWVGKEKWKRSEKSSKNHIRKKDEKERKKSIKSGLKTRLERFKNQKFSYPGEGDTPSPGPHPTRRGPTGLGAYTRPFGPRWCPPLENFPLRHWMQYTLIWSSSRRRI